MAVTHYTSWSKDEHSFEQQITLDTDAREMRLDRDANVCGYHKLTVAGPLRLAAETLRNAGDTLSHNEHNRVFQGDGYGADLRDIATWLGLVYEGPTPAEQPNLSTHDWD